MSPERVSVGETLDFPVISFGFDHRLLTLSLLASYFSSQPVGAEAKHLIC